MTATKAIELLKHRLDIDNMVYSQMYPNGVPIILTGDYAAFKSAIEALEKQIPIPVLVRRYEGYIRPYYYCPICNKQQKNSYKNCRDGCFCERCGQRLSFPEVSV